jgi:vacuolar iron transporter family protein
MTRARLHLERHRTGRIGWLRAAVLGANDGIVSTASLMIGVAAANAASADVLLTGIAGLVAGAMSMAAGEYVSVHSQSDTEAAELDRERSELEDSPAAELRELAGFYVARGVEPELAMTVAEQLTAKDALAAHARDELGITSALAARPLQAAWTSAASFAAGALVPLLTAWLSTARAVPWSVTAISLLSLAGTGALAAHVGGASKFSGAARVTVWGAVAMAVTAGVGALVGTAV